MAGVQRLLHDDVMFSMALLEALIELPLSSSALLIVALRCPDEAVRRSTVLPYAPTAISPLPPRHALQLLPVLAPCIECHPYLLKMQ